MLLFISFATDFVIFFLLWSGRVVWALQSPWFMQSFWFFVLYAASSALLLWRTRGDRTIFFWSAVVLHFFVTYGVALIVFPYGYGFDPIIHQATEKYITNNGPIAPLQPFYIGQYAVVVALHFITRLPIELLDRLLLPLLTVLTVPVVAYCGLVHGYKMEKRQAALATLLIPIVAFPALTFTVPYNLAVFYVLWWIFLFPTKGTFVNTKVPFIIALAALVTHPLIGIPLLIASVIALMKNPLLVGEGRVRFSHLSLPFLIPLMLMSTFGLYRLSHGLSFFAYSGRSVFDLFLPSFAVLYVPTHLFILYSAAALLSFVVIGVGVWRLIFRSDRATATILLGLSAGFFLSAITLYATTRLPGIIEHEQGEFARRLLQLIPLFLLPSFLSGCVVLFNRAKKRWQYALCCVGGGALLALSFYMTYPQVNVAKPRAGWNVAAHDISAVRAIEEDAKGEPYVVLADRLLSAVAVRELSFARAGDYSFDPRGKLFPYAEKMLKGVFTRADLDLLRRDVGAARIYIAVHEYWYNVENIADAALAAGAMPIPSPFGLRVYILD